jgi:hypothetical protein
MRKKKIVPQIDPSAFALAKAHLLHFANWCILNEIKEANEVAFLRWVDELPF